MKTKPLTLLITIHSQFDAIVFFDSLISENNYPKNNVIFAFDCEEKLIPKKYLDLIKKDYSYYISGKNIGKLNLVIQSAKKVETKYFKIIDQDDSIYFPGLDLIEKQLIEIEEESLIKHRACKIKSTSKNFVQSLDNEIIKSQYNEGYDPKFIQGTNCDVIYPTSAILKMEKVKFTAQHFHNDILLSNFVLGMGYKKIRIKGKFYIQFHQKGQTSKISIQRSDCIPELYENYKKIKIFYPEFNFKNIMFGSSLLHRIYIKNFTKWYLKNTNKKVGKINFEKSIKLLKENYNNEL